MSDEDVVDLEFDGIVRSTEPSGSILPEMRRREAAVVRAKTCRGCFDGRYAHIEGCGAEAVILTIYSADTILVRKTVEPATCLDAALVEWDEAERTSKSAPTFASVMPTGSFRVVWFRAPEDFVGPVPSPLAIFRLPD